MDDSGYKGRIEIGCAGGGSDDGMYFGIVSIGVFHLQLKLVTAASIKSLLENYVCLTQGLGFFTTKKAKT